MSLNLSVDKDSFSIDNSENLPKYCDYCKFFIVEELCLADDYRLLHYGKCCVIGKVLKHATGIVLLENVKITNLPK